MHGTHILTRQGRPARPVSAGWTHSYNRPPKVGMPPERFFDFQVSLARVCPETALMYAVLEDAFLCFQKQFETEQRFVQRAREAEDWFLSDDARRLFSFVSVCYALGLEPQFIRMKLKHRRQTCLDTALGKI